MELGTKLKTLRNGCGLTLKQLSEKTGLSISFISDIENGRRNPNLDNLNKLAHALNTTSDKILSEDKAIANKQKLRNSAEFFEQSPIPIFDDPEVRALARKNLSNNNNPEKEKMLKKLIQSMLEED